MLNRSRGGFLGGGNAGGTVTGDITMAPGTRVILDATAPYTAPALAFGGELDTGLYRGGTKRAIWVRAGVDLIDLNGSIAFPVLAIAQAGIINNSYTYITPETVKTGNYQIAASDGCIHSNGTTLTMTLPLVAAIGAGWRIRIVNVHASSTCTIARASGTNIDGANSDITLAAGKAIEIECDPAGTGFRTLKGA